MITRTPINNPSRITFCNSPINITIPTNSNEIEIRLWIWNGEQNQALGNQNYTFRKRKVSITDNYIHLEISQYIKSYLVSPPNAPDTNQPMFYYNELTEPTITGQAVFWQFQLVDNGVVSTFNTNVATLGYNWNYQQNYFAIPDETEGGASGFLQPRTKYYEPRIHNYIEQTFNFNQSVAEATTANIINRFAVTPPAQFKRCSLEPILVVFLNKVGLFEMFTTHGKVTVNTKTESETSARLYRNPETVDNSFMHSKLRDNLKVTQSYTINTGSLLPEMVDQVEEIIYSPKVYLVRFKGDTITETTEGITIDSTTVSIDDTNITIDSATVGAELISFFKTHQQIPVIVTNSDFERKTRLNNKKDIDFNITFEETNNKINDIR